MLEPVRFTHTLAAALPHASSALIDAPARARLTAIAAALPAALTRRVYLECRLGEHASRVDVVICVDAESRAVLASSAGRWARDLRDASPLWSGFARLCARWADPRSPLHACVYDLWLEFDADGAQEGGGRLPGLFIGFKRGVPAAEALAAAFDGLATVAGRPVDASVAQLARRVIRALPEGASLPYVGVMYPRDARALRLCVTPMAGASLAAYLDAIGWPDPAETLPTETRPTRTRPTETRPTETLPGQTLSVQTLSTDALSTEKLSTEKLSTEKLSTEKLSARTLSALLASLPCGEGRSALDAATLLHVDLRDRVLPRVGVEIPLAQMPQMHGALAADATRLLDALCARGLCAPSKREALRAWPGVSTEQLPHECWPSLALRRVSHVKIVCEAGRPPEAKTYLSFFHHYARGGLRRRHAAADAARRSM